MRENTTDFIVATALIFILFFVSGFAPSAFGKERSLSRTEDFVVLAGKDAGPLLGADINDLRLYSCGGTQCRPIPVQVDKVDVMGRYVFPQDMNFDRDGEKLDENDEISFMAGDAGGGIPDGFRPGSAKAGVEIELDDPLDPGRAWVYLFDEPGTEKPAVADYVSYSLEGESHMIKSGRYVLGCKKGRLQYDTLKMLTPAGVLSVDVLDRQRVGLEAQTVGDMSMQISVPETIIKSEYAGVIDGPVRVIIDELLMVHVGAISFQWGGENFNKYYRCGQNNSVTFEFPGATSEIFKTMLMYWSLDFTNDIIGSFYIDPNQEAPVEIVDKAKGELSVDGPHFWWALYGNNGAVLQAIDLDELLRLRLPLAPGPQAQAQEGRPSGQARYRV